MPKSANTERKPFTSTETRTLAHQIADAIANDILHGTFKPDEKLSEVELAERLNVSRGPIRDAFNLLERNMLVTIKPRSYTKVNKLTVKELEQLFTFREQILGTASRFAARYRTDEDIESLSAGLKQIRHLWNEPGSWYESIAFPSNQMWDRVIEASHSQVVHQACLNFTGSNIWANALQRRIDNAALPAFQKNRYRLWSHLCKCIESHDEDAACDAGKTLVRNNWNFLKKVIVELLPES